MSQTGTLKAGNQLVIDSQGASVDYDVSVTGYAVDFKRIQQKNTLSLGPHKVDCSYSVTVNYGSPSIYKVQQNGQREYTAETLPDPATLAPGETVVVDGLVKQSNGQYIYATDGSDRWNANSLLVIGDSRSAQGLIKTAAPSVGVTAYRRTNIGFHGWLQFLSNQAFNRVIVAARSGRLAKQLANSDTSVSYLDSLELSVIAPEATDAVIFLGTNDLATGRTGVQCAADILTIAKAARSSGKRVTVLMDTPRVGITAAVQKEWMNHANELYRMAAQGEFYLVDASQAFIDWANTTALTGKSTMYYDATTHQNGYGAYVLGKALADHYAKLLPPIATQRVHHYLDNAGNDATNLNMIANSRFASSYAGWTISSPTGIATAITGTRIAAPDGFGYALAVDVTVNAAGGITLASVASLVSPAYVTGDCLHGEFRATIQGNGGTGDHTGVVAPFMRLDIAGDANARMSDMWFEQTPNPSAVPGNFAGTCKTMPYFVTGAETGAINGSVNIGLFFASAGSARLIITAPQVVKNTTPYKPNEWLVQ